jgi:hypothetical protein
MVALIKFELCLLYKDLLFFSNSILSPIRELLILKQFFKEHLANQEQD